MNEISFTCEFCGVESSVDPSIASARSYNIFSNLPLHKLDEAERTVVFALRNVHAQCFDNVVENYGKNFHEGSYVSTTVYDEDIASEAFVFQYVHEIKGNMCEVWTINSSPRYIRKGGEFLQKSHHSIDDVIAHTFTNYSNTALPVDLQNVLYDHWKRVRRELMIELVASETESMLEVDYLDLSSSEVVEAFSKLFKDMEKFESNVKALSVLTR